MITLEILIILIAIYFLIHFFSTRRNPLKGSSGKLWDDGLEITEETIYQIIAHQIVFNPELPFAPTARISANVVWEKMRPENLTQLTARRHLDRTEQVVQKALQKAIDKQAGNLIKICEKLVIQVQDMESTINIQALSIRSLKTKLRSINKVAQNIIEWCDSRNVSTITQSKNHYQILEISTQAILEEIKKAYRLQINAWHPDKFQNNQDKLQAEEKTKLINEAFAVLSDRVKRSSYDKQIGINK